MKKVCIPRHISLLFEGETTLNVKRLLTLLVLSSPFFLQAQSNLDIGYFGSYITQSGISVAYNRPLKLLASSESGATSQLNLSAHGGAYFHQNLHRDAFITVGPQWVKTSAKGGFWGLDMGLGISKTMLYAVYTRDGNNPFELTHFKGDVRFILSPAVSFGHSLKNLGFADAWYVKNRFWYYPSYSGQSTFNYFLEVGIRHNFSGKK